MRLGTIVYFKHEGILKIGFIKEELRNDELLIISEEVEYIRKCWEIAKVKDEK